MKGPRAKRLIVAVTDAWGRPIRAGGLGRWLERAAPATARGRVAIALLPDSHVRRLNRAYRRIDRPTDVLSFPGGPPLAVRGETPAVGKRHRESFSDRQNPEEKDSRCRFPPPRHHGLQQPDGFHHGLLGDIAIARGVAARQARRFGHSEATEWRVLALHGLLHLLGYDHETDRGEMSQLEARLRRRAGLPAGLLARAARPARPAR